MRCNLRKRGGVQRLLADAEAERAAVFRTRGNLERALPSARSAVAASKASGSRWTLPQQLAVQASIFAALGRTRDADQAYEEAADVLEGTMLNVPNATAQARLVGVMSDVYTGHFKLAAEQRDPRKAYEILERARGRALADVLRGSNRGASSGDPQRHRAISQLQVRLMRAQNGTERRSILDALWEAEDVVRPTRVSVRPATRARLEQVELAAVQQQLAPSETLLEYVLSEPRSYCLVITRTGIDVVTLPSSSEINTGAETFVFWNSDTPFSSSCATILPLGPLARWPDGCCVGGWRRPI